MLYISSYYSEVRLIMFLRYTLIFFVVGNIPYEATEEQLKDIFSEVGPVVSFR